MCLGGASGSGLDRVQTEDCPLCNFTEGLCRGHYSLVIIIFNIKFSELQTRVWLIGPRVVPGCVSLFLKVIFANFQRCFVQIYCNV